MLYFSSCLQKKKKGSGIYVWFFFFNKDVMFMMLNRYFVEEK